MKRMLTAPLDRRVALTRAPCRCIVAWIRDATTRRNHGAASWAHPGHS